MMIGALDAPRRQVAEIDYALLWSVLILLFIYWHASVKKWFTGPIKQVEVS